MQGEHCHLHLRLRSLPLQAPKISDPDLLLAKQQRIKMKKLSLFDFYWSCGERVRKLCSANLATDGISDFNFYVPVSSCPVTQNTLASKIHMILRKFRISTLFRNETESAQQALTPTSNSCSQMPSSLSCTMCETRKERKRKSHDLRCRQLMMTLLECDVVDAPSAECRRWPRAPPRCARPV